MKVAGLITERRIEMAKKMPKEGFRIDTDQFWRVLEFAAMGSVEARQAADALTVRTRFKRPARKDRETVSKKLT